MDIKPLTLSGVYEVTLKPQMDHRGHFMRTFDKKIFGKFGIDRNWVQENHSLSTKKGTIRGLHLQLPPFSETKLIRVIKGAVFDVFIDLRKDSPTFGKWDFIELTEDNFKMVLIPRGFAHGFCTLTDHCELMYKVDNFYSPNHEAGILYDDPILNIDWPVSNPILSKKDSRLPLFEDFIKKYNGMKFE
ncbi:dTDP-4-dehydrorhamnose 3,5-epimerase [Oikeobacillus pervagus]|uniref:dTDP-4-dehydrorhamnose 3,5-epimerase n=1 Tax=Oikeobacillus pervagus TaxID=1325931 RepID=A0AAJ1T881_9BACI|nr:dTDP-4-dehydrorhamnose 3,5-epimerase [Oikeobacillus pervagus]MDQ0216410.1 dTDP-4-dehydrorhamnose 3,5-epimerase [Oikeobacillus pervagus]